MFLARALAQDADLLLLDEPFAGVDEETEALFQRLRRLWSAGTTVVAVHHDLGTARSRFDDALLMAGSVVATGPASERSPRTTSGGPSRTAAEHRFSWPEAGSGQGCARSCPRAWRPSPALRPRGAPTTEPGSLEAWMQVLSFGGGHNTNVVLLGTILLGVSAGTVGSFAMLKGRALVADAISHASLVGVALAFLLHAALGQQERSMPVLMLGAALSGACAVVAIEWLARRTRLSPETAVATVSSASFGAGIVALSATRRVKGADRAGLDELIFGSTASMTRADALLMAVLAAAALVATLALYRVLTAVAFNERFARSKGLPVGLLDATLAALVGAVAMAGLQAVGMLLVAALLVAPAATARLWTTRVAPMVLVAAAAGASAAWVGASISAAAPNAPVRSSSSPPPRSSW